MFVCSREFSLFMLSLSLSLLDLCHSNDFEHESRIIAQPLINRAPSPQTPTLTIPGEEDGGLAGK
jgi:hypothetical protein